uniref:Flavin-containing monooxygenase n=1 Tax=Panagrellus redivivus TaxID=6233 RepID=A0A7E5A2E1_PANRE
MATNAPKKRVAIIGAAASGLPAIRHALLYDLEPVCFELTGEVGGLWRFKEGKRVTKGVLMSSVMRTTVINTSKEMTAYSDFPPAAEKPNFMPHHEMLDYLESYAKHHNLHKWIRFHHKVETIERHPGYKENGKWNVTFLDESDNRHTETFDAVLLANGHHSEPRWPAPFPGQENFKGTIIHSHDYTTHQGLEDKVVVVVGIGNSGGDVAVELSRIAKQVYLSTRRGTWICNRLIDGGKPFDSALNSRKQLYLSELLPERVKNYLGEKMLSEKFDHDAYGLKPKHRLYGAHPTVNDELPNRLANRTVKVKSNIKEYTENGIIFDDGTTVPHVDTVIYCTGFKFNFPLVENGNLIPVSDNVITLYMNMFAPELSDHNSIAILGLVQPWGSIMPISEMQARVFYDAFTGNTKLPDRDTMNIYVSKRRDSLLHRYVNTPRHTIQVDYSKYMDELADLIGAKPEIRKLALKDPLLAWKVFSGPATSYTYRLIGPKKWDGARDAIFTTEYRILAGMAPEGKISELKTKLDNQNNNNGVYGVAALGILLTFIYLLFSS